MTYLANQSWPAVVPDYMPDFRSFLRTQPSLAPLHGGRVYFNAPDPLRTSFPYVRLYLINEIAMSAEVPGFQVRLGLHVWGNNNGMYAQVRQLMNAISSVVWQLDCGILVPGGQTYVYSASMSNNMELPDPATGWPRRVGTVVWLLRMAGSADQ